MALYRTGAGNMKDMAQRQTTGASRALGGMTRENQVTEISPGTPPATQIVGTGVGLTGTANQLWNLGEKGYAGVEWLRNKFNAPDAGQTAANASAGAQATAQASSLNGMQLNSGAQVAEEMGRQAASMPDFVNGAAQAGFTPAGLEKAGELASQSLTRQMYATPMLDSPEVMDLSARTASRLGAAGPDKLTGIAGAVGPAVGGIGGGLAGREIGRAIGGDTGATVGGLAGSLGGAWLGGMAASELAGGAAAGAVTGSAVPGLGTFIGAGMGALTSLFL